MSHQGAKRRGLVRRSIMDFTLGLVLFICVAAASSYLPHPDPSQPPVFSSTAFAAASHANWALSQPIEFTPLVARAQDPRAASIILGITFASLFAFNMGLFRHLRRVYASPR